MKKKFILSLPGYLKAQLRRCGGEASAHIATLIVT